MEAKDYKQFDIYSPEYREIKDHANVLKGQYTERDDMFQLYENMFNMNWKHDIKRRKGGDTIKPTISPTARNKVLGSWRLLISQDPKFKVRSDTAEPSAIENLEKFISIMWQRAGKVNGRPLHHDIILSMLLYGEAHVGINTIQDYKAFNPEDKRVDRVGKLIPILFDVWNPLLSHED